MSLPLRITVKEKDYTYTVLTKSITKETNVIRIYVDGEEYELIRSLKGDWTASNAIVSDNPELLNVIARNIKLRYRL